MIPKMIDDALGIGACAGSKYCDVGCWMLDAGWYNTHALANFSDIFYKKPELTEGNTDEDNGHGPDESNKKDINQGPQPILLDVKQIHDLLTHITCQTSTDCKSGNDKRQLKARYFPFCLKSVKHDCVQKCAKKAKKMTSQIR